MMMVVFGRIGVVIVEVEILFECGRIDVLSAFGIFFRVI